MNLRTTAITLLGVLTTLGYADDTPTGRDQEVTKERADASVRVAGLIAAQYDLRDADEPDRKLKLVKEPLLRWTNPVPQSADQELPEVYGGVFLWTDGGRPSVVASVFRWYHPWKHVNLEMLIVDERRKIASLDGTDSWMPKRTVVGYEPIPDSGTPARNAGGRLLQMRRLARGFAATKADAKDNRTELRLLPQPLYRYQLDDTSEVLDGALFVIAHGTDPEIVLLVEARKGSDGNATWQFGAARLNHLDMWMNYGGKEVWRVNRIQPYSVVLDPTEPYCQLKRPQSEVEALDE